MKKVFTLLTLALLSIGTAWADDEITVTFAYDKINATGTGTASVASVIETTSVALTGTKVSLLKFNGTGSAATYNSVSVPAYSKVSVSNDDTSGSDDGIRFTIIPAEGCTFTPTSVSLGAIREGTDAGSMYVYANGTAINEATLAKSPVTPGRNKTGDGYLKDGYTFSYNISAVTATPEAPLTIDVCMSALKNKSWGLWNVVITGTYTKEEVTTYTLTTTADPAAGGTITRSPNQAAYQASKSVTLTATPNYGYEFVNWTKDDVEVSTSASYAITTAAAAETYVAHFNALTTYALTVSANNDAYGTVAKSPDHDAYLVGEEVTLTATPKTGYGFVNWTKDDVEVSTNASYNITTTAAATEYVANFVPLYSITFNVDAENKGTSSTGFATQYANTSNKWTAPINYYVAKEGYTLTAWNDGENDYTPGTEYTLAGNITIAPVFTANTVTVADFTAETTVSWPFATSAGAPTLASEGNTQYYVKQATIAGNTVDVPIFVNTTTGYGISGKNGKFNNSANNSYAQVNNGTVFKIPAVKGMLVKYMTNQTTAVGNIGFTDNTSNLGGDGSAFTTPTVISGDNKTISYTYTGTADYLYLVDKAGGKYPTGISVTYPGPAIGSHSMTWTLSPLNTTDKTLTSSQASTTENLTNLTTIDASKITFTSSASKAGDRTAKIDRTVNKDANTYVSLTFDVKDGCTFTPSAITIKVANVSNATTFDAELIDENDVTVSETGKSFASTDGTVETWTISNSDASKKMTGTVTLKIYAYAETAGSFRFGNSIAIAGDVAEFVAVSTLADRNYASYVPAKKLDFSAADGITAYIATGLNGGKTAISLTEVDVVAAGTPIIVKTDTKGATVNVPMTIADATDASENKLVAGDGTTSATADVDYVYYYLASDQFHKATSGTLQSGKAYLKIAAGDATAHDLTFDFGDMTTGINMVNGEGLKVQGSEVYNLNGQRVLNPTKGLYIVNGRKVVVK